MKRAFLGAILTVGALVFAALGAAAPAAAQTAITLGAEGVTTLLVEQNAHLALEVSDRAYVLERGRVILEGSAATLLHHPQVQTAYLGHEA